MIQFLFTMALIPLGIFIGILIQNFLNQKEKASEYNEKLRNTLQRLALLILNPIAFMGGVWILPLNNVEIIYLPILGIIAIALSGAYSLLYTRTRKMNRPQRGSHFCASYFTNIGSIGGLVVFALLGESGFTLMPFYKLFEVVMYFGIGFPIASRFGSSGNAKGKSFLQVLKDPFVAVPMMGVFLGLILNMSGVERPGFYTNMNSILIPLASVLLLVSIGLAMRLKNMLGHAFSALSVLLIKYMLVPLTVTVLAYALGMGRILDGLPLKAVFILSSMPSGFVAVIPPSLYHLDLDYANTAWTLTMIAMIPLIPWLYFSLKYIFPYFI